MIEIISIHCLKVYKFLVNYLSTNTIGLYVIIKSKLYLAMNCQVASKIQIYTYFKYYYLRDKSNHSINYSKFEKKIESLRFGLFPQKMNFLTCHDITYKIFEGSGRWQCDSFPHFIMPQAFIRFLGRD